MYAPWKDFRGKRPLANVRLRGLAPGFSRTTTVALATGRAYNGPLCFSRMIGTARGFRSPPRSLAWNPVLSGGDL